MMTQPKKWLPMVVFLIIVSVALYFILDFAYTYHLASQGEEDGGLGGIFLIMFAPAIESQASMIWAALFGVVSISIYLMWYRSALERYRKRSYRSKSNNWRSR
jgi:tryptophan-rich sensory protein